MTMTSAAYDAIIAEILGGYEKPEAPEEKPKGLGAMTSRAGMKMPEVSDETEVPSSQAAVNKFMTAIASQRGSKAPAFVEKAYDPLTFTSEHMQRAGMKVMDALAMALEDPQEGKIKVPVGEDFKEDYFTNAENILNQMKSAAQDSSLDIRTANLTRGMTSKQTDTQPTVSADSSRDRLELQGEIRDLPVLDDEGAPEVDTLSNELLDKELPSDGLGSRPVEEEEPLTDDDMGLPERDIPDYNFMLPGSEFRKSLKEKEAESYATIFADSQKKDTPFKDVDVTEMTMDEVLKFVKLNGPFHKYNKNTHNKNTTAIGKYQFVGATLRDLKKRGVFTKLGIKEDTLFDEDTQDKLSAYQAIHRIKDRSDGTFSSARKEMRNEWEGFKKLSDTKLDIIIKEIADEIGVKIIKTPPSELAPKTSLRPRARPDTRVASN